jgi:predicted O-methyltransferase YrrM
MRLLRKKQMFKRQKKSQSEVSSAVPIYSEMRQHVPVMCYESPPGETQWYPPVMVGAGSLARNILTRRYVELARDLLQRLTPDDYGQYMIQFYEDGVKRLGDAWRYADIVTVLLGLTEMLKPRRYLEIGVRRGRSACAVASMAPSCDFALFDMWIQDYAGMENPGPEFVRAELAKVNYQGRCEIVDGDSHRTLPRYFAANLEAAFDLITVDGDHTDNGASQDLCDVLPRLTVGGAIVFDDVSHPKHPGLRAVWRRLVAEDPRFSSWSFDEVGYGVAFAVRKW